ncbi:MAG: L,D-transpeptidase family protein [Chromatiales bacterium]|nr:L,D-transpeptidase family protein [Chromatiales bacterium]
MAKIDLSHITHGESEPSRQPDAQPIDSDKVLASLELRLQQDANDYEAALLHGLVRFKQGDLSGAIEELEQLSERAPKFYLAHLLLGDLYQMRLKSVSKIEISAKLIKLADSGSLQHLRNEADARLNAFIDTIPNGRLPRALLHLDPSVGNAILVDKSAHRLYLYRWDEHSAKPYLVRDFYVSTGKLSGNKQFSGDFKTPEGVYFITRHIPDEQLPEKYGIGAFPMNYPNELDRHLGKTGYGIWLHGTESNFYSRPPLDSEGCVVLPNIDLSRVDDYLQPGKSPVIVTEKIEWMNGKQWSSLHDGIMQAIEKWRSDWESGDVDRYLAHYADGFWSNRENLSSWQKRKRRIATSKKYQRVKVSELSLFAYPKGAAGGSEMVVANFEQRYESNNYQSVSQKRLYLTQDSGQWRVLYEGEQ